MTAVTGRAAGFIATLYFVNTVIGTKDYTNVSAAANTSTQVTDVADMGTLQKQRNIIDVPVYGADVSGKLPGQADPGQFDFNVTYHMDNTIHNALRDDDGTGQHSFIVKFSQGANETYAVFDGYIATADVSSPIDDRIQMDVSVARDGGVTWVDAT